jgi:DNA-binding Lrp family transcriptional regulator
MVYSYVLISTKNTYENEVAHKLARLEEVVDVEPLLVEETALADPFFEEYDLIVKIKAANASHMKRIINNKIHTIVGIDKIMIVSKSKTKS